MQAFLAQHRDIKLAHATKNMCCEIWDYAERPDMASFHFLRWFEAVASLPARVGRHFEPLCEMIAPNAPDVLNYFERPLTNAPTEAVNHVVLRINGAGQGLAFAALQHRVRAYSRAKVSRLIF